MRGRDGAFGPTAEAALCQRLAGWTALWGVPGLEKRLRIRYSTRMRRTLGRCFPARGLIRLHAGLASGDPDLLDEVLCHEAAHAAAWVIHGRPRRPHGREWADLMCRAGYVPRVRFPSSAVPGPVASRSKRAGPGRESPAAGSLFDRFWPLKRT